MASGELDHAVAGGQIGMSPHSRSSFAKPVGRPGESNPVPGPRGLSSPTGISNRRCTHCWSRRTAETASVEGSPSESGLAFHRVPIVQLSHLDELYRRAASAAGPLVLVFDADNTLVRQGAPAQEFAEIVNGEIDRFTGLEAVNRVVVITNGPERGVDRMISRGNKPWTGRARLGLAGSDGEVWVIGDQILIDGVLAWRLGARFIHLVIAEAGESPRQATMRLVGSWVRRLFFRTDR